MSQISRLTNWTRVEQAIDESTVEVPSFNDHHPKEPSAAYHNGTFFVVCAVWSGYAFPPASKEVVLCASTSYDSGFEQISQVTAEENVHNHAPGLLVAEGTVWLFHSRNPLENGSPGSDGWVSNDIHLKHAPVDEIPVTPDGWVSEGSVLRDARDPGIVSGSDGTYHLFAKDERGEGVVHATSTDLHTWSNRTTVYTDAFGEAPEIIPKSNDNGYWLVSAHNDDPRITVAAEAETLAGPYSGTIPISSQNSLNNIKKPFHSKWTLHHDYLYNSGGQNLHIADQTVAAYFEAGDGEQFSIGVCTAPSS